jgi:Dehydrogenases (flavoproteins)
VLSALASIPSKFDAIVVGAGPAGSAAAYTLAKEGFKTLLIDRGRGGGEKELFGGRVYAQPLRDIWPELDKEAPHTEVGHAREDKLCKRQRGRHS